MLRRPAIAKIPTFSKLLPAAIALTGVAAGCALAADGIAGDPFDAPSVAKVSIFAGLLLLAVIGTALVTRRRVDAPLHDRIAELITL